MPVRAFSKNGRGKSKASFFSRLFLAFGVSAPTMATTAQATGYARQAARAALHKARPSPTAALAKPVKKHERLAKTLEWLNREPKPVLEKISSLQLTYAYKNDHWGARYVRSCLVGASHGRPADAPYFPNDLTCVCFINISLRHRHFAKEELPRIAYNNPSIHIRVDRRLKKPEEAWKPIMKVGLSMSRASYFRVHTSV